MPSSCSVRTSRSREMYEVRLLAANSSTALTGSSSASVPSSWNRSLISTWWRFSKLRSLLSLMFLSLQDHLHPFRRGSLHEVTQVRRDFVALKINTARALGFVIQLSNVFGAVIVENQLEKATKRSIARNIFAVG